jgi:transketolase
MSVSRRAEKPAEASREELERDAQAIRRIFLRMHYENKACHLGTGLSSIDLLTYIYREWLAEEDQFILSKGHGASALYATLHYFGLIPAEQLKTYYQDNTLLPIHPAPRGIAAIPISTGSLGHGLSIAAGLAFARKHLDTNANGRVACLLSDGECNEGSTWEAILFAAHHKLDNLVAIVDANGLQGFGRTADVMNTEPFADKWRAFNFEVREIDGHDLGQIQAAFAPPLNGMPVCILARTIKGKGVSYMENKMEWHYLSMNEEQFRQALVEQGDLGGRRTGTGS